MKKDRKDAEFHALRLLILQSQLLQDYFFLFCSQRFPVLDFDNTVVLHQKPVFPAAQTSAITPVHIPGSIWCFRIDSPVSFLQHSLFQTPAKEAFFLDFIHFVTDVR